MDKIILNEYFGESGDFGATIYNLERLRDVELRNPGLLSTNAKNHIYLAHTSLVELSKIINGEK